MVRRLPWTGKFLSFFEARFMPRTIYFITHPNVVISRGVAVPQWPLSELGRRRMKAGLSQPWISGVSSIYCSTEQKAIDGAEILADHLSIGYTKVHALGENDRSATGFMPRQEFEAVADVFFAKPFESIRGWEKAADAQARIVEAVVEIAVVDQSKGAIAIVAHGAVGTLLYCHLSGLPIARRWDQPPNNGGNYYSFEINPIHVFSSWRAIDEVVR
jgi:broad specificity phosphatase PhoE